MCKFCGDYFQKTSLIAPFFIVDFVISAFFGIFARNFVGCVGSSTMNTLCSGVEENESNYKIRMRQNNNIESLSVGIEDAMKVAKTYMLDKSDNRLMVIENAELLQLQHKTFHMGIVVIALCKEGHLTMRFNDNIVDLPKGGLFVNFSDSRISEVEMSPDFSCTAIVVSQDFMQESFMSLMHLWPYLLYVMESPVLMLGESEMRSLMMSYEQIIERLTHEDHCFRREATIANVQACYLDVCDFLKRRVPTDEHLQARAYALFDQFVRLVANNYVEHRDVQWYADNMQITPKYLSEVVKAVSGRTSSQWITNFVITEIKSLLRNSDLSIKEIAVEMHFASQSFLGKYFKNVVGVSPNDFRANL